MKLVSWNVNGLKACMNKGFKEFFYKVNADFFCIQETKISDSNFKLNLGDYNQYWSCCERKGYSGTAIFTNHPPIKVTYGMDELNFDDVEGRVITLEYDRFFLINVYTPNSKHCNKRLDFRSDWDDAFRKYVRSLNNQKPLIICGDMNVTHLEIDEAPSQKQTKSLGFAEEERERFLELLEDVGLKDSFRYLNPTKTNAYTWWSYRRQKRDENSGLRIDYFLVSDYLTPCLQSSEICFDIQGSDHCPIMLEISI